MSVWEFVVVYLAAFVLVQLAIYRYLRGRSDESARVTVAGPPNADRGPGADRRPGADRGPSDGRESREPRTAVDSVDRGPKDAVRRCPNCGAANDLDGPYTFCRNCASRLPG